MGKPTAGYEVAVVDDQGQRLPSGQLGNIAVSTEPHPVGLFSEYLNNEEETRKAFRSGWYFTGDKASVDEEGYFWFSSRADDVITSAAYRIGPFEVESALLEHPAVQEAAVVGKDDPERTLTVCAFVILAKGFVGSDDLTRELQEHVKRVTAPYKYPREIRYCTELPKPSAERFAARSFANCCIRGYPGSLAQTHPLGEVRVSPWYSPEFFLKLGSSDRTQERLSDDADRVRIRAFWRRSMSPKAAQASLGMRCWRYSRRRARFGTPASVLTP
jgi:hypothetical protein